MSEMVEMSERKQLEGFLAMMRKNPIQFEQTPFCRNWSQLLPSSLSSGAQVEQALREIILNYFLTDIDIVSGDYDHGRLLGSLLVWGMYFNQSKVGGYVLFVKFNHAIDDWGQPEVIRNFFITTIRDYARMRGLIGFDHLIDRFINSGHGINPILERILNNNLSKKIWENKRRNIRNNLYGALDRLVDDIKKIIPNAFTETPPNEQMDCRVSINLANSLRELGRRRCIVNNFLYVINRTIEAGSVKLRLAWSDAFDFIRASSGVLVGLPHTGRTTYVSMVMFSSYKSNDTISIYLSAPALRVFAMQKRRVYDYIGYELIKEDLITVNDYSRTVDLLCEMDMAGQLLIFVDDLERVDSENQREIVLQFAFCPHVFFITSPWTSDRILGLMNNLNSSRSLKLLSLCHLAPEEQLQLLENVMGSEDFYDLRIAYPFFPDQNFCGLVLYPLGIFALADEFSEWGKIDALEITLRIFNSLLEQIELQDFQIEIGSIWDGHYKFHRLGETLAYRESQNSWALYRRIRHGDKLFWHCNILDSIFGNNETAKKDFADHFLEPQGNSSRVQFFFPDFHYLILAIYYVHPNKKDDYLGAFIAICSIGCTIEDQSPFLDADTLVLLYELSIEGWLSYLQAFPGKADSHVRRLEKYPLLRR